LNGDDTYDWLPIGFDFPFYDNVYHGAWASSNGLLSFDAGTSRFSNDPIPSASSPNNFLAPFWDDQSVYTFGDEHVYYETFGSVPNRYLVVQWRCRDLGSSPLDRPYEYEVILHEDGTIIFQYNDMGGWPEGDGRSATVGIENAVGSDGVQYSYNVARIADELAIRFGPMTVDWLDEVPRSGVVAPAGNQPVQVVFSAVDLAQDVHTVTLVIENNDTVSGTVYVPATMTIAPRRRTYLPLILHNR
jgi:hypothetical protein